jgi:hypothetical protein
LHLAGGILRGNGEVNGVLNEGIVAPGNSIGTLSVGTFTQNAGGVLAMELFVGQEPLSDLLSADTASLSGTVDVTLLPGDLPQMGDRFTLVTATSINVTGLQLRTSGFGGRLDVVTFTAGALAGKQGLQLTIVPEPAEGMLLLAAVVSTLNARRRQLSTANLGRR